VRDTHQNTVSILCTSTKESNSDTHFTAPILDNVDISYHVEEFDGRFVKESIYRQVGSPEVDAAWESLGVGCELLPNCTKLNTYGIK
jgi:Mycotoxin biosynthesis protein UstYa